MVTPTTVTATGAGSFVIPAGVKKLFVLFGDNGVLCMIVFIILAGGFRLNKDVEFPSATTAGKCLRMLGIWNAIDGYWDVPAVVQQA